jgi:transposase
LESLPWLDPYSRVTTRLAESVGRLAQVLSVKHVADFFGLKWDAVKAIDKALLERTLGPPDLTGVDVIGLDEFSLHKGHRYATVVVDPRTKRVLWVGRGRKREDLEPFFRLLGPDGCRRLKAAVMDMNAWFEAEVRRHCPNAEVVFDLFHVVAKYARQVIDRVRIDQANTLRKDKRARKVVKGARWLLLRNRANISSRNDRVRLTELLAANRPLMTVYVLRDDLKHLWSFKAAWAAKRWWEAWYKRAVRSRLKPLVRFARLLQRRLAGVLAHCRWPLHTSLIEGINNKIKVIKRTAYGFRDHDYFFLKIRAAFPGNAG